MQISEDGIDTLARAMCPPYGISTWNACSVGAVSFHSDTGRGEVRFRCRVKRNSVSGFLSRSEKNKN